jgi:hypothetical protein
MPNGILVYGKVIKFWGHDCTLICDKRCGMAWGTDMRPKKLLSPDDDDDYIYLSDGELSDQGLTAPIDPGSSEGGYLKPKNEKEQFNKWCVRKSLLVWRVLNNLLNGRNGAMQKESKRRGSYNGLPD